MKQFKVSATGGTFDVLHKGHMITLSDFSKDVASMIMCPLCSTSKVPPVAETLNCFIWFFYHIQK